MGSIEPYETAKGRRYRALYRRPEKKQTQKRGFRTKKAAELFLATTEVDIAQGRYLDPSHARVTVADWLDTLLKARGDLRATTRSRVENIIEKHIVPELGSIPIGNLTRLRVQEWASALPGAPATVRKTVNVLSGALRFAVEDGRLPSNPAQRLKLPKPTKTRKHYLSHNEVAALAQAVDTARDSRQHGYGLVVLVLAYCGLRWGELPGLRICDLDLDAKRPRLTVEQTIVADKGYQRIEPPKDYEPAIKASPTPEYTKHSSRTRSGIKCRPCSALTDQRRTRRRCTSTT